MKISVFHHEKSRWRLVANIFLSKNGGGAAKTLKIMGREIAKEKRQRIDEIQNYTHTTLWCCDKEIAREKRPSSPSLRWILTKVIFALFTNAHFHQISQAITSKIAIFPTVQNGNDRNRQKIREKCEDQPLFHNFILRGIRKFNLGRKIIE